MDTSEKIGWTILCIVTMLVLASLSCTIFLPHTFEGYYLYHGEIYASYNWQVDERAFSYTPEMWEYIIKNNLHIPRR